MNIHGDDLYLKAERSFTVDGQTMLAGVGDTDSIILQSDTVNIQASGTTKIDAGLSASISSETNVNLTAGRNIVAQGTRIDLNAP